MFDLNSIVNQQQTYLIGRPDLHIQVEIDYSFANLVSSGTALLVKEVLNKNKSFINAYLIFIRVVLYLPTQVNAHFLFGGTFCH